jgi:molybdopterin-guanine dinucleotide biosynthesis protein A
MRSASVSDSDGKSVVGLVIAGGRSVRFGGEKAVALLDGRPLLQWAAERLKSVCADVAINVRAGTEAESVAQALGLPTLYDAPGDAAGPLAGVKAGLLWAEQHGARALAVSPCDAPLLPDDLYARLVASAGDGAAMAETAEGRQPLCALWPIAALPIVCEALAGGAHPPTWQLLEGLGAKKVLFERPEAFANVNTREDLAAVEGAARIGRLSPRNIGSVKKREP